MKKGFLTGLLLFGIFFGAGNLIFPPILGAQAGEQFPMAIAGFIISGVGLAVVTLILGTLLDGGFEVALTKRISPWFSTVYLVSLYLAIGPFFAIPRTAATSYQIGILPMVTNQDQTLLWYTLIYFGITYVIAMRPTKLLDYVGKFLTPIFAGLIVVLIIFGSVLYQNESPNVATTMYSQNAFGQGFLEGYNTLDALAAVAFSVVATQTLAQLQFESKKAYMKTIAAVGVLITTLFSVLYIGLGYLGNRMPLAPEVVSDQTQNIGAYVLSETAYRVFGDNGRFFLALLVMLTCLTTTIGLVSATANYFSHRFPKWSYQVYATVFTLIGFGIANIGLNGIIQYSVPVLVVLYPITMTFVLLFVLQRFLPLSTFGIRLSAYVATVVSLLIVIQPLLPSQLSVLVAWLNVLPLAKEGMQWVVPVCLCILLACVLPNRTTEKMLKN